MSQEQIAREQERHAIKMYERERGAMAPRTILSEEEVRTLIAESAYKLAHWMHKPDVATNELVLKTVRRMNELATELETKIAQK
jgi:hypothetical protein